jgi:hypothetical protein
MDAQTYLHGKDRNKVPASSRFHFIPVLLSHPSRNTTALKPSPAEMTARTERAMSKVMTAIAGAKRRDKYILNVASV